MGAKVERHDLLGGGDDRIVGRASADQGVGRRAHDCQSRNGQKGITLDVGPGGERPVRFATVQHSEENAAGHSGFGAVWGSKKLKAVSLDLEDALQRLSEG